MNISKQKRKAERKQRRQRTRRQQGIRAANQVQGIVINAGHCEWLQAAVGDGEEGKPKLRKFRMEAYLGGLVRQWWSRYPIVVDLATLTAAAAVLPTLRDHDRGRITGHGNADIGPKKITFDGVLSAANEHSREVAESSDNGFPWQVSIGADPGLKGTLEEVPEGQTVAVNGRKFKGPIRVARNWVLHEASFLANGEDSKTSAVVAAGKNSKPHQSPQATRTSTMDFNEYLEARGFDIEDLSEPQVEAMRADFERMEASSQDGNGQGGSKKKTNEKPIQAAAGGQDDEDSIEAGIQERREREAKETERIDAIVKLCREHEGVTVKVSGKEQPLQAHAIREGWSLEKVELEVLKFERGTGPSVHSRSHDGDCSLEAMQGAMLLRAGGQLDHEVYSSNAGLCLGLPDWLRAGINEDGRQQAMEAAHRYSDMSLVDVCREALRLAGQQAPHGRDKMIQAAVSSGTLLKIFTTSVNARVLATYMEAEDSTRGWTKETDVADYKLNERNRMTKKGALKKRPRGKTANHTSRADTGETYKIANYADQFFVDKQDIIDDSFNALADTPDEMAMAAARLRPDLVYAILLANDELADGVALFNLASHNNLRTSAALAKTTLEQACTDIKTQVENSVPLNLRLSHLIVPAALEFLADQLTMSSMLLAAEVPTSQSTLTGSSNPLARRNIKVVSDARLDNGVIDPDTETLYAGSTSTWFGAAVGAHGIEVAFLRGTGRAPQVTGWSKNGEDGVYGIGWSCSMDIGAAPLDFRGLHKNTQ